MSTKTLQLRIALRHEGDFWNAYIARPDTMDGARLIASMSIGAARNPKIKEAFINLTKMMLEDAALQVTGKPVAGWEDIRGAPESERSGHG